MTPAEFQACREKMGLTRRELALLLGYRHSSAEQDYNTIKRYENGTRAPSPMCVRLLTMVYRHFRATGALPEFEPGE